ncbi:MAG TPA: hypothetical protein VNR38_08185 [Ureibacillus sp.]|uniref:hypothetical protein n=1 Tax=Peribacillus asahii TaxID=228899 RepID=UPI00207A8C11|nr:hypothetical protein [Peribacillus asahii]USK60750.1 hypothetical protein LIT37_05345 [Peribacillus asahii]HWL23714.1 hypothetical protein [Ureibacillus sp.]
MTVNEYCGSMESSILDFIFSLTDEILEKIQYRKLFYQEQIARYVQKQIDFFFNTYNLKTALLYSYKHEAYNTIMFKLKNHLKEHNILQCV